MEGNLGVVRAGREPADEPGTPIGVNVAIGSAAMVAAALVGALLPASATGLRLVVVTLALAGFATVTADAAAAAVVVVIGYLLYDGFLVNRLGELSWRGTQDVRHVLVLAGGAVVGVGVGELRGWLRQRRRFAAVEAYANQTHISDNPDDVPDTLFEEEWRDAGSGVRAVDSGALRAAGADREGGGTAVNAANLVGLVLAVALTVFLVVALLFPERF